MLPENVPQSLRDSDSWVCWRFDPAKGKIPHTPEGAPASHSDPATWRTFEEAAAAVFAGRYEGIGFVFHDGNPFSGVDLDHCFSEDGTLKAWAVEIVALAQSCGCYIERSPSGLGLHIIGKGKTPEGRKRALSDGGIEVYSRQRFFTVTGDAFDVFDEGTGDIGPVINAALALIGPRVKAALSETVTGTAISDDEADEIAAAYLAQAGAKYAGLWRGVYSTLEYRSESEARLALVNAVCFFLEGHATVERLRSVLLRSPLIQSSMRRGKWPRLAAHECAMAIQSSREQGKMTVTTSAWDEPTDLWSRTSAAPDIRAHQLPPLVARFAFEQSRLIGVDPGSLALVALATCAGCITDEMKVQVTPNDRYWLESARLWVMMVGDPSVKKTPAIKRATSHTWTINGRLMDEYAREMSDWEQTKKDERPPKPAQRRLVADDVTIEKLGALLADNVRGMLVIKDEMTQWFGSMGAYSKGGAGKDQGAWLQLFNGGAYMVDRMSRPSLYVKNFGVSLIGGVQPDAMTKIASTLPNDGLLQRFITVMAHRVEKAEGADDAAVRPFNELLDHLFRLRSEAGPVRFSRDADAVRRRVTDELDTLIPLVSERLGSHFAKLEGLYARICLLFHCIECAEARVHPEQDMISVEVAERAGALMLEFIVKHILAFHETVLGDELRNTVLMKDVLGIASQILNKAPERLTKRWIVQNVKRARFCEGRELASAMAALEGFGWVRQVGMVPGRGRPNDIGPWEVNPSVHTSFKERAEQARVIAKSRAEKLGR